MENNRLVNSTGFFVSSATTLAISAMLIEYILFPLMSFFEFSFIAVLFIASLYLRSRLLHLVGKNSSDLLSRIAYITTSALGIVMLLVFVYFGLQEQNVTFSLSHYSFNPYLMTIAAIWAVYSFIEIFVVNGMSKKYSNFRYLTYFSIILVALSVSLIGYVQLLLPIALILLSISTFISGLRVYSCDYRDYSKKRSVLYNRDI